MLLWSQAGHRLSVGPLDHQGDKRSQATPPPGREMVEIFCRTHAAAKIGVMPMFAQCYVHPNVSSLNPISLGYTFRQPYVRSALYSLSPMFPQHYVPTVLCSLSLVLPQCYVHPSVSSLNPISLGHTFRQLYVR